MGRIAAHIDVVPTLLEACSVKQPKGVRLDGISLLPLLENKGGRWPERTLYFQWHRGDAPEMYRDCACRADRWKLVMHLGKDREVVAELYDMIADPGESRDVAGEHPEIVRRMRAGYEAWFKDVSAGRGYDPPRIYLGTPLENPTTLTRQDWRGPKAGWGADSLGYWEVLVATAGSYEIALRFPPAAGTGKAHFKLGDATAVLPLEKGAAEVRFESVSLKPGPGRLEAWLEIDGKSLGVHFVDVSLTVPKRP